MAYTDKHIKIDSTEKKLTKKIQNNIKDTSEKIYWYIRFNIPLDEKSVSNKTMKVTNITGLIINTEIIYNKKLELIIISPLQKYVKEEYYILHIDKKVKSQNNQNIKKTVHILFKIKDGQVVEFKEIADNIKVPKPRVSKFKNENKPTKSRVYKFEQIQKQRLEKANQSGKLPFLPIHFNPTFAMLGLVFIAYSWFFDVTLMLILGIFFGIIGFYKIIEQVNDFKFKSIINYNLGVILFNREKFEKANKKFEKALYLDPKNELAEFSLNKTSFYL